MALTMAMVQEELRRLGSSLRVADMGRLQAEIANIIRDKYLAGAELPYLSKLAGRADNASYATYYLKMSNTPCRKKVYPKYEQPIRKSPIKLSCDEGDIVWHEGRKVLVQQIIEKSNKRKGQRSYIKGCLIDGDGKVCKTINIYPGYDWRWSAEVGK
jgi:hypothetical protein